MMPNAAKKPAKIILRTYQVGFGDCFLLTFDYGEKDDRHVLIDFGSTGLPKEFDEKKAKTHMLEVAEQIRRDCHKKLHVVVATHRHKDHISGFSTTGEQNANGETSGDIIRSCKPDFVVQPWTENPNLDDKTVKEGMAQGMTGDEKFKAAPAKNFAATLFNMQRVAGLVKVESERLGTTVAEADDDAVGFTHPLDDKKKKQLFFMGDNNVANESAVMNLRAMGAKAAAHFVAFGDRIGLSQILPGVKVKILGPPTLEQHHEIIKQRSRDDDEFWMFHSMAKNFWGMQAMTANLVEDLNERDNEFPDRLFPKARVFQNYAPSETRWFIRQVRTLRADQLLGLVRILDKALNNTSVILLFEVGDKKLLFPGDAQIENWEYALSKPEIRKLLRETTLYKVGHHGSRNATPKSLWSEFKKRSTDDKNLNRLKTVNSTMAGKHGHTEQTAVPRRTLVNELVKLSDYHTTQNIRIEDGLCEKIEIEL
jgi:hypothetical protein